MKQKIKLIMLVLVSMILLYLILAPYKRVYLYSPDRNQCITFYHPWYYCCSRSKDVLIVYGKFEGFLSPKNNYMRVPNDCKIYINWFPNDHHRIKISTNYYKGIHSEDNIEKYGMSYSKEYFIDPSDKVRFYPKYYCNIVNNILSDK